MTESSTSGLGGTSLIASDRVEGTAVYSREGHNIGSVKRLLIETIGGRVAYAVVSFGGFLGIGQDEYTIPWNKLAYDASLNGYRTDITEDQLRGAPAFSRTTDHDWTERAREKELHDYYEARYYWDYSGP